jgi:hypothetical protein
MYKGNAVLSGRNMGNIPNANHLKGMSAADRVALEKERTFDA